MSVCGWLLRDLGIFFLTSHTEHGILDDLQIYLPLFTGMPRGQKTHNWMVLKDYNSMRDVLYLDWPQLAAVVYPD